MANLTTIKTHPECLVCGKTFSRGQVDLLRHQQAITLKHLYSDKKKGAFTYNCAKCDTWFLSDEHLLQHKRDSSCAETDSLPNDAMKNSPQNSGIDGAPDLDPSDEGWDPSLECIVCGKYFRRGSEDLQLHISSSTLLHQSSKKSTKAYTIPCEREGCHNWFLSVEHMRSHMKNSSCNPDRQRSVDKDKVDEDSAQVAKRPIKLTKGQAIAAGKARAAMRKAERAEAIANGLVVPEEDDKSARRARQDSFSNSEMLPRSKRAKVLIPDDRKAFFSVASLLIDSSKIPPGTKLTAFNFEDYIPHEKRSLLARLREHLLYDC